MRFYYFIVISITAFLFLTSFRCTDFIVPLTELYPARCLCPLALTCRSFSSLFAPDGYFSFVALFFDHLKGGGEGEREEKQEGKGESCQEPKTGADTYCLQNASMGSWIRSRKACCCRIQA